MKVALEMVACRVPPLKLKVLVEVPVVPETKIWPTVSIPPFKLAMRVPVVELLEPKRRPP